MSGKKPLAILVALGLIFIAVAMSGCGKEHVARPAYEATINVIYKHDVYVYNTTVWVNGEIVLTMENVHATLPPKILMNTTLILEEGSHVIDYMHNTSLNGGTGTSSFELLSDMTIDILFFGDYVFVETTEV